MVAVTVERGLPPWVYASRPMNTLPATTPGQAAKLPPRLLLRDISADLAHHEGARDSGKGKNGGPHILA